MQAEREDAGDWFYTICNDKGDFIASTSISKGAKHTLSEIRVNQMAHQLRLSTSKQFVDLHVECHNVRLLSSYYFLATGVPAVVSHH